MLHWLYMYVASVCFKYFSCFKCMLHILQCPYTYVALAFILQVFHAQAWQGGAGEGDPLGRSGPHVRSSRRGAQKPYPWAWQQARSTKLHPREGSRCGARGEMEHKAASMGSQETRSTRRSIAWRCIHRRRNGIIIERRPLLDLCSITITWSL